MTASDQAETLAFSAPEMSCGHCVAAISRAFAERLPGAAVEIDLAGRTVRVAAPEEVALSILAEAGYPAVRI